MRVISQDGKIDSPYELTVLRVVNNCITMCMAGEVGKGTTMAWYSTPENAQKAMEILSEKYRIIEFMKISCTPEVFEQMKRMIPDPVFDEVISQVFRFPTDENIVEKVGDAISD